MIVTGNPTADLNGPVSTCEVQWTSGVVCPNAVSEVAVCTHAPGFLPMCELHAATFKEAYPDATVRWLSLEAFEAERLVGLYR